MSDPSITTPEGEYQWHSEKTTPSGQPDAVEFIDVHKAFGRPERLRDHDVLDLGGVTADDVATVGRPELPRELELHEGEQRQRAVEHYSPRCAELARSAAVLTSLPAGMAYLDGVVATVGLSIWPMRSISLIHCDGFSALLSCRASLPSSV